MATNHTENYQLNLWEPSDSFLRTEFNENFTKLDAALGTKGNCRIVFGSYTGQGKGGSDNAKTIEVPDAEWPPRAVFVTDDKGVNKGLFLRGMPRCFTYIGGTSATFVYLTWTEKGVRWYGDDASKNMDNLNETYYYFVLV